MRAFVRSLLLLVLTLAVPFHAALGVTVGQCKALDHPSGQSTLEMAAAHDHSGGHDHAQHGRAGSKAGADGAASDESHCGPCTACCTSAAITGFVQSLIVAVAYTPKDSQQQHRPASIRLDRLDRPPLFL